MGGRKGVRPEQYVGVFQYYEDIPERYRLGTYADQYAGEDTLGEYVENVLYEKRAPVSDFLRDRVSRASASWREHMDERGRHHALATPADVEAWCDSLLDQLSRYTAYRTHFVRINRFYEHLTTSYRHPHVYNPFLVAAVEGGAARYLWTFRIDDRDEVVDRE